VNTEGESGAAKSDAAAKIGRLVENFLRPLTILDFVSADAATYAQIRARLERAGKPIGPLDTLIAAQAVARKLTLVSSNRKEFGRVPELAIENWADRAGPCFGVPGLTSLAGCSTDVPRGKRGFSEGL
jgi:tRNA(fMet)-specific endonuclease VapC